MRECFAFELSVIHVNKRFVSIIVLILTVLTGAYALPFTVNIGTIQEFQKPVGSDTIREADVIDVNNWASGVEIRVSNTYFSLDAYGITRQGEIIDIVNDGEAVFADGIHQSLFGMAALSITTEVAEFTTLSVGAGPAYGLNLYEDWRPEFWLYNEDNVLYGDTATGDLSDNFSLSYRARLDISFIRFSAGISYSVSSFGPEDPYNPDWKNGKLALSFITRVL